MFPSEVEDCRIGVVGSEYTTDENMFYKSAKNFLLSFFPHLNCSTVTLMPTEGGDSTANATGFYRENSVYGALQYNKINILAFFANLNSFENTDVFRVDAPVFGSDAILVNAVPRREQRKIDVLQTFDTVSVETYYFLVMTLSIVLKTFYCTMKWSLWTSLWILLTGLINQLNDDFKKTAERIIWFHFNLFIFFAVYGIFGGLISADMTVTSMPPRVESLSDIMDPYFNATPVFFKQLYIYNLLEKSPDGSIKKKVLKRAEDRDGIIVLPIRADETSKTQAALNKFLTSLCNPSQAYLDHDVFVKGMLRVACIVRDIKEPFFSTGSESFGNDIFVFPYSSRLSKTIRRKASNHLRRLFEADLFHLMLRLLTNRQISMIAEIQETRQHQECSSLDFLKEREKFDQLHPPAPAPLSLQLFHGPMYVLAAAFLVCEITFMLEHVIHYIISYF